MEMALMREKPAQRRTGDDKEVVIEGSLFFCQVRQSYLGEVFYHESRGGS